MFEHLIEASRDGVHLCAEVMGGRGIEARVAQHPGHHEVSAWIMLNHDFGYCRTDAMGCQLNTSVSSERAREAFAKLTARTHAATYAGEQEVSIRPG